MRASTVCVFCAVAAQHELTQNWPTFGHRTTGSVTEHFEATAHAVEGGVDCVTGAGGVGGGGVGAAVGGVGGGGVGGGVGGGGVGGVGGAVTGGANVLPETPQMFVAALPEKLVAQLNVGRPAHV